MDIIIGRESGTTEPRLCLKIGNTTKYMGAPGSVPKSVSRSHCVVSINGDNLSVNNVSDQNALYVNGMEYKTKSITELDLVELGPERYRVDLSALLKIVKGGNSKPVAAAPEVKSYNIRPLKRIWDNYTEAKLNIQTRERKIGAYSAIPGAILAGSGILACVVDGLKIIFGVIAVIAMVVLAVVRSKGASNVPFMHKELDEKFQDDYVCPHCSHFLGNQSYKLILRNGGCPWCKSKFTE